MAVPSEEWPQFSPSSNLSKEEERKELLLTLKDFHKKLTMKSNYVKEQYSIQSFMDTSIGNDIDLTSEDIDSFDSIKKNMQNLRTNVLNLQDAYICMQRKHVREIRTKINEAGSTYRGRSRNRRNSAARSQRNTNEYNREKEHTTQTYERGRSRMRRVNDVAMQPEVRQQSTSSGETKVPHPPTTPKPQRLPLITKSRKFPKIPVSQYLPTISVIQHRFRDRSHRRIVVRSSSSEESVCKKLSDEYSDKKDGTEVHEHISKKLSDYSPNDRDGTDRSRYFVPKSNSHLITMKRESENQKEDLSIQKIKENSKEIITEIPNKSLDVLPKEIPDDNNSGKEKSLNNISAEQKLSYSSTEDICSTCCGTGVATKPPYERVEYTQSITEKIKDGQCEQLAMQLAVKTNTESEVLHRKSSQRLLPLRKQLPRDDMKSEESGKPQDQTKSRDKASQANLIISSLTSTPVKIELTKKDIDTGQMEARSPENRNNTINTRYYQPSKTMRLLTDNAAKVKAPSNVASQFQEGKTKNYAKKLKNSAEILKQKNISKEKTRFLPNIKTGKIGQCKADVKDTVHPKMEKQRPKTSPAKIRNISLKFPYVYNTPSVQIKKRAENISPTPISLHDTDSGFPLETTAEKVKEISQVRKQKVRKPVANKNNNNNSKYEISTVVTNGEEFKHKQNTKNSKSIINIKAYHLNKITNEIIAKHCGLESSDDEEKDEEKLSIAKRFRSTRNTDKCWFINFDAEPEKNPVSTQRHFNVDSTSGDVETTLNRRHVLNGKRAKTPKFMKWTEKDQERLDIAYRFYTVKKGQDKCWFIDFDGIDNCFLNSSCDFKTIREDSNDNEEKLMKTEIENARSAEINELGDSFFSD